MKTIILSSFILLLASANAFAQKYIFRMYRFECSELFDINLTKPKGFKVIDGITPFKVNEGRNAGMFYRMALESKAKDCLILYPNFYMYKNHDISTEVMVCAELESALNLNSDNDTRARLNLVNGKLLMQGLTPSSNNEVIKLDSAKYIKMIAEENMEDYFNADTVFIWKVPLLKPYKVIYNECIGVNVIKKGHPSAIIKILLTEEGKKKEEEYLQILLKSIHYSDTAPEYNQEKIDKTINKMKNRFVFNMKKYLYHGYVGSSNEHRK